MQNEYFKKKIILNTTIIKLIAKNCQSEKKKQFVNAKIKRTNNFRQINYKIVQNKKVELIEEEKLLNSLVSCMDTDFKQPEEEILREG